MTFLRPVTTGVFNRFSRHVVGRLPWFGLLIQRGRVSGREHRTPMNVFRRDGDYVLALTYGSEVNWVRNVLAAGRCRLLTRGREIELVDPRLVVDPTRRLVPLPVRLVLRLVDCREFLLLRPAP
jgi:deazaflavin-dependent oxidoreductase (nitroreductase family)